MAVREALPLRATNGARRTFPILATELGPVVIAELKLRETAMQMLFAAMLIHTLHAALENREVVFERVSGDHVFLASFRIDGVPHVFLVPVVNGFRDWRTRGQVSRTSDPHP